MVDWFNDTIPLDRPLTLEEQQQDCTAILVPDLLSYKDVLEYLEPFNSSLFEMELKQWERDRSAWPEETTGEMFDAWFAVEVHSMVWDFVVEEIESEQPG